MAAITPSAYLNGRYSNMQPDPSAARGSKPRFKVGYITLAATADDGDTTTVNCFEEFGISKILAVEGFIHTTTDSVIVEEAPTTTVDREILTITVGGSTDNKKRFYVIYGI